MHCRSLCLTLVILVGILAGVLSKFHPLEDNTIWPEALLSGYLEDEYSGIHNQLKNMSLSFFRILEPTLEHGASQQCLDDFQILQDKLENVDYSALQVIDSWGKLSSGILEGNLNQYGDFDQCIQSKLYKSQRKVDFQYCLYSFGLNFTKSLHLDSLIHSHFAIKNRPNDPMHRIPHFSSFHWGLCIPKTCDAVAIEHKISQIAKQHIPKDVEFFIQGSDKMCYQKQHKVVDKYKTFATLAVLTIVVGLCLLASSNQTYQYLIKFPGLSQWLQCFSAKENVHRLLKTELDSDEVGMLNGARVLSAMALLLSHKHMALLYSPYVNRTSMAKMISHPWTVIGRTAIIYTDGFILISGFLTAKTLIRDLKRYNGVNIKKLIVTRLARLAPSLLTIIVLSTWVLPNINRGPLWNMVVTKHSELCQQYWWRNMMFIHNFFGFENMCLTHTHQIGIDFQLFLVCILLVLLAWKNPKVGFNLMLIIAVVSTLLRYIVTYTNQLSVVIYYGISVSQLFNTANLSYILPTHRLTVYLMGIAVSFYLEKTSNRKISQPYLFIGWVMASACGILAMFGPYHMANINYQYDATEAALYNALSPILWGVLFSWTIITSANKQAGIFGALLEWKWFKVIAKLTYSIYLIQFPIFFYNVGIMRNAAYFTTLELFNVGEYAVIGILSAAMTLVIELPVSNMNRLYWISSQKVKKVPPQNGADVNDDLIKETTVRKRILKSGE